MSKNFGSKILVAFIVNSDGTISGARIITDKTIKAGQQVLDITKSFKWTAGRCGNKNVATIYTIPLILDSEEQ